MVCDQTDGYVIVIILLVFFSGDLTYQVTQCADGEDLERTIEQIREAGVKVGVSIKPATPVNDISHMLSDVDMVLIMTVQPGFGGQKYMEECTEKIREVRELIEAEDLDVDVQVDGGINDETMETVLTAGANLLVAGSYVFNDDLAKNVKHARERMDEIIRRID